MTVRACTVGFLLVLAWSTVVLAADPPVATDNDATLKLGERLYRQGVLPDGKPLKAFVRDIEIDSTIFSCENCHTRSGLGSVEGQVVSPPVNGPTLYRDRFLFKDEIKNTISKRKGVTRPAQATRPAYTDETLGDAIRGGTNPDGREFLPIMPRYEMNDAEMAVMISYLKNLSKSFSPGVDEKSIRFATIVTDEVSVDDRQALLASLETLVTINQQTKTQRKDPRFAKMFRMLDAAFYKDLSIKTWVLKGEPATWRAQLEEYYRKEPVFAVLGGISYRSWQPMHDFCEDMKLPCLFPITDLPVISETSWYTFYASKGYYQEGETAARFLAERLADSPAGPVLQVVRTTPEGNALAAGFAEAWQEKGLPEPITVKIQPDEQLSGEQLRALLGQKYGALLLWTGKDAINAVTGAREKLPPQVMLSSRYLGGALATVPEALRDQVFLTYPFRLPEGEKAFANYGETFTLGKLHKHDSTRIATRTFSMIHLFLLGFKEMKLNYYRDTLLDSLSMLADQYLPDFVRYSFGPGQRYASKGCYVVQLGKGAAVKIVPRSDWVVF